MQNNGGGAVEGIIASLIILFIAVVGFAVYKHDDMSGAISPPKTTTSKTVAASTRQSQNNILTPAPVASKVALCAQTISYSADGVPGPIQCTNGDLNSSTWKALAALEPKVLALGYSPTAAQVQANLCSDVAANISNPIELAVYQISSLYYGWSFSSNPSAVLSNGSCQNADD